MTRGEIWLAQVGNKTRPVVILTRTGVIDVRNLVTVAEITTSARGLTTEVEFDHELAGLDRRSVINSDGIHTIAQSSLTGRVGVVDSATLDEVCRAVSYALGC